MNIMIIFGRSVRNFFYAIVWGVRVAGSILIAIPLSLFFAFGYALAALIEIGGNVAYNIRRDLPWKNRK